MKVTGPAASRVPCPGPALTDPPLSTAPANLDVRPVVAEELERVRGRTDARVAASTGAGGLLRHRLQTSGPTQLWREALGSADPIGTGAFCEAFRSGDWVLKQVKSVVGDREQFRLGPSDLERVAKEIERATKRLRSELGGRITPIKHEGGGLLRAPFAQGAVMEELMLMDELERASDDCAELRSAARDVLFRRTHGATRDGGAMIYLDGRSIWIDPEASNFRFDPHDGSVSSWFDPVVVRPPDALRV